MNRSSQSAPSGGQAAPSTANSSSSAVHRAHSSKSNGVGVLRFGSVALLFSATVLVVAVVLSIIYGGNIKNEIKYVDSSKLQVVSLSNGLVYIGHITSLNSEYVRLRDTFYITPSQNVQGTDNQPAQTVNYTLLKPGCEIFGLQDEMVINRRQLVFWENLRSDGKAAKGVEEYKKQNPNGQKCDQTSSTSNTSNTTNTTNTTNSNASTTGTTNSSTKKP